MSLSEANTIMEDPFVKVQQGQLRGINKKNINGVNFVAFRGIPYAKPPVGTLRFKDSEPMECWHGVRNAFNFGGRCAQVDWITRGIVGGDDCLYLNVYTPTLNSPVPQAVMVWIHGGGFIFGSGEDDFYGPDYLIEKDVVLVTINYRVGILGFLNIEDEEAPGNQGLKDQVQALKWVQQNIAQFGGDPKNVTIFGESAGGASVHYLAISPLAQGLFHKAIMQSGDALNPWASLPMEPIEPVKKLAAILGKDVSNVREFVDYLRTLDAHQLVGAAAQIRTRKDEIVFIHPFVPTVDSKAKNPFLTKPIDEAAKAGIRVPCMCGYLSHEGMIIVAGLNNDMYDEINADPKSLLIHPNTLRFLNKHNITVDDVKRFYLGDEKFSAENFEKIVDMLSDIYFIIGLHSFIETQTKVPDIPMYLYKFEYEVQNSLAKKFLGLANKKGTCHMEELGFLFLQKLPKLLGKQPPTQGSIEHVLIQRFTELWTNFAKIGNPTPRKTDIIPVEWQPVDNATEYKCLNITDNLSMGSELNITRQLVESRNDKL